MIEQNVQLVRCKGDRMWVRLGAQTGCSACDNGEGCGAGVFAKLLARKPVVIELERRELDVQAGQMLTLSFPESVYLKLVAASYGWPLLALLAGAWVGHSLAQLIGLEALWIDISALGMGVLGGALVVRMNRQQKLADIMLKSLRMAVCSPSSQAGMCSNKKSIAT